ncbi:hypothetical protein Srufu_014610 [Streptomyces libani subsp. rufus]|nr:hypothetical protein Srufu_014610 [Streptomyces libani subsp. rufus]
MHLLNNYQTAQGSWLEINGNGPTGTLHDVFTGAYSVRDSGGRGGKCRALLPRAEPFWQVLQPVRTRWRIPSITCR